MAAGKTYDVMINVPAAGGTALPDLRPPAEPVGQRDRARRRHAGVHQRQWRWRCRPLPISAAAVASADTYNSVIAGQTLTVSDPAKGVIANDVNVYGVTVVRRRRPAERSP